jgi:hypothetical protein
VDFTPPRSSSFRSESLYRLSYHAPRSRIVGSLMENVGGSGRGLTERYTRLINACLDIGSSVEGRLRDCRRAVWVVQNNVMHCFHYPEDGGLNTLRNVNSAFSYAIP